VKVRAERRLACPCSWLLWCLALLTLSSGTAVAKVRPGKKLPAEQPHPLPHPPSHPPPHPPPPAQDPLEIENSLPVAPPPPGSSASVGAGAGAGAASSGGAHAAVEKPVEKAGRFLAGLKIGPALCLYACEHQGALVVEIGYSVLPNKNAYLIFPLQFQFAPSGAAVIVPVAFQYDIAVPRLTGLYVYPRLTVGYALILDNATSGAAPLHGGIVMPEFGLKYVFRGRWNLGGELFSLPFLFGQDPGGSFLRLYYRITLSAGVNF